MHDMMMHANAIVHSSQFSCDTVIVHFSGELIFA